MPIHFHLDPRELRTGMALVGRCAYDAAQRRAPDSVRLIQGTGSQHQAALLGLRTGPGLYVATRNFDFLPARRRGLRQSAILHDLILLSDDRVKRWIRLRARLWAERLDVLERIAVVSEHTQQALDRGLRPKVKVTPPGLSPQFWQPVAEPTGGLDQPYWLYTGGRNARKRIDLMLAAFAAYRSRGGRTTLVSTAPLVEASPPWLHTVTAAEPEHLNALYRGAQGVLYLSEVEGYGLPVLESAATGVPCLTTRNVPAAVEDEDAWPAAALLSDGELNPDAVARRMLDIEGRWFSPTFTEAQSRQRWDAMAEWLCHV